MVRRPLARQTDRQEERARFGYMPEERGLYPRMRGTGPARVSRTPLRADPCRGRARTVDTWLDRLGCGRGQRPPRRALARQPAACAAHRALVNEPDLLVLDEPFSGLDPLGDRRDVRTPRRYRRQTARPSCSRATSSTSSRTSARTSSSSTRGRIVRVGDLAVTACRGATTVRHGSLPRRGTRLVGAARGHGRRARQRARFACLSMRTSTSPA